LINKLTWLGSQKRSVLAPEEFQEVGWRKMNIDINPSWRSTRFQTV